MAIIGVFDSGVGGLSVLKELRRVLPEERYVYFSDNANCPYGDKTAEFVLERGRAITRGLIAKGAEAVVVACNTATSACISQLRAEFDIPFVGMEPAVKPAAQRTVSGVVGVLATAGTLKGSKYLGIKGRFGQHVHIEERVGAGFVELVENLDLSSPHAEKVVSASLLPLLQAGADVVVLGCTHYPFLLPIMEKIASKAPSSLAPPAADSTLTAHGAAVSSPVTFINPAPAVARQLATVLQNNGIALIDKNPGVELLASGSDEVLKRLYSCIV